MKVSVTLLQDLQQKMKLQGARVRKGATAEIIFQCTKKYNLPASVEYKRVP
jgi:hypothetical protein